MKTRRLAPVIISGALLAAGCDDVSNSPKIVEADGQTYIACRGLVWVTSEGGGLLGGSEIFKVSFTDAAGITHTLRGLKKVTVSDVPTLVPAPMPLNPSLTTSDGKPVVEGNIYSWSDGSKARFHNGAWEPVQIYNDACKAK